MNTLEATLARLVTSGAILDVLSPTRHVHLIGELVWLGPRQLFWFTAHGDRMEDGHVLDFAETRLVGENSVEFFVDRQPIARLTAIANAAVDDRDDYTVAFSIWQQIAPEYRQLIDRSRESTLGETGDRPALAAVSEIALPRTVEGTPAEAAAEKSMTEWDIASLLAEVCQGAVAPKTAIALMVMNGIGRDDATRRVDEACDARDPGKGSPSRGNRASTLGADGATAPQPV